MQLKTARRFLARNRYKLTVYKINETGTAMLKRAKIAKNVIEKEEKKNGNSN